MPDRDDESPRSSFFEQMPQFSPAVDDGTREIQDSRARDYAVRGGLIGMLLGGIIGVILAVIIANMGAEISLVIGIALMPVLFLAGGFAFRGWLSGSWQDGMESSHHRDLRREAERQRTMENQEWAGVDEILKRDRQKY